MKRRFRRFLKSLPTGKIGLDYRFPKVDTAPRTSKVISKCVSEQNLFILRGGPGGGFHCHFIVTLDVLPTIGAALRFGGSVMKAKRKTVKTKVVVGYTRVSTTGQGQNGISLEAQEERRRLFGWLCGASCC